MINSDPEKFLEQSKNTKLSNEEKSAIKQSVLNFISKHPVSSSFPARRNFWSSILLTNLNFASTMAILLIFTVLVGGGITLGAEKALPGDILYPVKVGFSEEVRGWASISEESKANWEVKRAERRLTEAEEMATQGTLDVETREKLEANFDAHTERVKKRIEKFENKENFKAAADVSTKFETSLKAHQKILDRLSTESSEKTKKEVKPIHVKVRSEADNLTKVRRNIEIKAGGEVNSSGSVNRKSDPTEKDEDNLEVKIESELESEIDLEL